MKQFNYKSNVQENQKELQRRAQEEIDNMNVEIEKEILIEERIRLEEEKEKMAEEMKLFKDRMKQLYIEDMIKGETEMQESKEQENNDFYLHDFSERSSQW